jgi:hypothetical protein
MILDTYPTKKKKHFAKKKKKHFAKQKISMSFNSINMENCSFINQSPICYAKSPYIYFKFNNPNVTISQTNTFCIRYLQTSMLKFVNNDKGLMITIPKNDITNEYIKPLMETFEYLETLIDNDVKYIFEKGRFSNVPLELFHKKKFVSKFNGKATFFINLMQNSEGVITTKMSTENVATSLSNSKNVIDISEFKNTYNKYKFAYVVFTIKLAISKNGDLGIRKIMPILRADGIYLGNNKKNKAFGKIKKNQDINPNTAIFKLQI